MGLEIGLLLLACKKKVLKALVYSEQGVDSYSQKNSGESVPEPSETQPSGSMKYTALRQTLQCRFASEW